MAETKKKGRLFDLPETKGLFQLKGIVSGVKKDNFYKEIKTKSNKDMRIVNFGLTYKEGETLYENLQGIEQEFAYFSKRAKKKGEKADVDKIPWSERFSYNREGYSVVGVQTGIEKKVDSKGSTVNDKKNLTNFDACKEIADKLKDNVSVYTKGTIDYSSFIDDKGNKKVSVKLVPNQISLCKDIDFDAKDYEQDNDFNQVIIFMGIEAEKDSNEKQTGRFVVTAKIITYSTIEDVEFIIENRELANQFRKNLKPYYAIKVSGHIVSSIQTEEVSDDDNWGEEDSMEKIPAPVKREFIITGAKGSSIDKELYTEENITEAMAKITQANKAKNDFGTDSSDGWGSGTDLDDDDEKAW